MTTPAPEPLPGPRPNGTIRRLRPSARKAGLPPGTPVYVGEGADQEVSITVTTYDPESYQCTVDAPLTSKSLAPAPDQRAVTWIKVAGLSRIEVIERLGADFGIHPLVLEDIVNTTQRPKVDVFDDYLFIVLRRHDSEGLGSLAVEQISMLLGRNFLLTFQERQSEVFDPILRRLADNKGRLRKMGPDYLAYALTDAIIDHFFTTLEQTGEEIEILEEQLIAAPSPQTLHQIHALKRKMLLLRKSVWPLREVISALQRDDVPMIGPGLAVYLKDLYDHTIHIIDTVETFRDVIAGMLDIYLSSLSIRLNEIMKILTMFTAIFIPMTLVAGIYGMNFNPSAGPWNMPELGWAFGYPMALGLMACLGLGMTIYFKRKGWF